MNTPFTFTTGSTALPDVGTLAYNGCTFSSLFTTNVSGKVIKDEAHRTTKLMEYKLSAEGVVTLNNVGNLGPATGIELSISAMRLALTQQGGILIYEGRGFSFNGNDELAWGPVPELIEFQPLGGGLSAKVKWEVTFRLPDSKAGDFRYSGLGRAGNTRLLQFNYETSLTYNEDYCSSMTIKGTMEIPLNRLVQGGKLHGNGPSRKITTTVDDVRTELDRRIFSGIDLSRFYVTHREYNVSRDKRTMQFSVTVEEKPYMDLPPYCTMARGSYNVRPAKSGPGLALWLCTLRATYTVARPAARRWAWDNFLLLLQLRMSQARLAETTKIELNQAAQNPRQPSPQQRAVNDNLLLRLGRQFGIGGSGPNLVQGFFQDAQTVVNGNRRNNRPRIGAWLIDFSFDEGLYKDSKTTTFSATWRLVTTLSHILLASGIWKKVPETGTVDPRIARDTGFNVGNNLWAASMAEFSGATTWAPNYLDPSKDIIIDFGY